MQARANDEGWPYIDDDNRNFDVAQWTDGSGGDSAGIGAIAQLANSLSLLPAGGGDALRLRYLEGLRTKEIAQRLGKSDGAVRVLLTRTLQALRERFKRDSDLATLLEVQRRFEEAIRECETDDVRPLSD